MRKQQFKYNSADLILLITGVLSLFIYISLSLRGLTGIKFFKKTAEFFEYGITVYAK